MKNRDQNLAPAMMEPVEPRQHLSGTVTPSAYISSMHTLRVNGTENADVIRVYRTPSNPDRLIVNMNGEITKFNMNDISRIVVSGKGSDDMISLAEYTPISIHARLMGDGGDDTIVGGTGGDLIFGGDGNDLIFGGGGRDRIDDGAGSDIAYGQTGKDWFVHKTPAAGSLPGQTGATTDVDQLIQ